VWAEAAGGHLGVVNDPTWTNGTCFLPFPFPATTPAQTVRIQCVRKTKKNNFTEIKAITCSLKYCPQKAPSKEGGRYGRNGGSVWPE